MNLVVLLAFVVAAAACLFDCLVPWLVGWLNNVAQARVTWEEVT